MSWPANLRGWGQGWPVDRSADMVWVRATRSGARWQVHREIGPIIKFLVNEVERRGYLFDHGKGDVDDDWGYANRAIRGRNAPSNHSWGLAIDIDAQQYPMGQSRRNPPSWIVDLFERYGFEWGGRWRRPDPMHFEWKGTVSDARWTVASLAAHHVAGTPAPVPPSVPKPPPPRQEDIMATKAELRDIVREVVRDELERSQLKHHDATRSWIREELKRSLSALTAEMRNRLGR